MIWCQPLGKPATYLHRICDWESFLSAKNLLVRGRRSLSLKAMNQKRPAAYVAGLFFLFAAGRATAATVMVDAAPGGVVFSRDSVMVQAG